MLTSVKTLFSATFSSPAGWILIIHGILVVTIQLTE